MLPAWAAELAKTAGLFAPRGSLSIKSNWKEADCNEENKPAETEGGLESKREELEMPIAGVEQPELIAVDENIRLRKFDGVYDFAFDWYQDGETVYLVDGKKEPYTKEKLRRMYEYLDSHGELYFIETRQGEGYKPIGDVTFWKEDMPIVIGDKNSRGKGIGQKVIQCLIERGRSLGYDTLKVDEIYTYNLSSRKCFEKLGFKAYEQTERGERFRLRLKELL